MKKISIMVIYLAIFFNIWFPKCGIKIGTIPITLGNILFGALLLLFPIVIIKNNKLWKDKMYLLILTNIIYFTIRLLIISGNGFADITTTIIHLIVLVVYPILFLVINEIIIDRIDMQIILKIISYGFVFLAIYSVLQCIFGIQHTTIAGLTANYNDVKESVTWYLDKSNGNGSVTKLIATYQNGNLFGANLIIFFPLVYEYFSSKNKLVANIALIAFFLIGFLTLSRTVWIGLGLYFLVLFFRKSKNYLQIIIKLILVICVPIAVILFFQNSPALLGRLAQTNYTSLTTGAGRIPSAMLMWEQSLSNAVYFFFGIYGLNIEVGGAYEMIYAAIYENTGIIGVSIFLLLFIRIIKKYLYFKNNYIVKGVLYGMVIYLIIAAIDGGLWLPPTGMNLWIITSIGNVAIRLENSKNINDLNLNKAI